MSVSSIPRIVKPTMHQVAALGQRYLRHPRMQACEGFWLFNENGGEKVWDISGHARHGTFSTNLDPATAWVPGLDGPVLNFNENNEYVDTGWTDNISGALSVAARVMVDLNGFDVWWTKNGPAFHFLFLITTNTGAIRYTRKWSSGVVEFETVNGVVVADGRSYIISVTDIEDTSYLPTLWVNGRPYSTSIKFGSPSGSWATNSEVYSWGGHEGTRNLNGRVSWGRMWSRALTDHEHISLHADPFLEFQPEPRVWEVQAAGGGGGAGLIPSSLALMGVGI